MFRDMPRHAWPAATSSPTYAARHQLLTDINTIDLVEGLGVNKASRTARLLQGLIRGPAGRFASQILAADEAVGQLGLQNGLQSILPMFVPRFEVHGLAHVPASGPVLLVSNHPGLVDTLMLLSHIPRPDLQVIAADRPFLRAIPNVSRYLMYVPGASDARSSRMALVRQATRHLRGGGALLTFPAGQIEPDPALCCGAAESVAGWSDSISAFARLAPDLAVVPIIVSGVLSPRALAHPLTRIRRTRRDQEWLAATMQIVFARLRDTVVRLQVGAPIHVAALPGAEVGPAVQRAACKLIANAERWGSASS